MKKIALYFNTLRYLKLKQVYYQIVNKIRRFRTKKSIKKYKKVKTYILINNVIPELDLSSDYLERFKVEELLKNNITLLNETHKMEAGQWYIKEASHLWNFNLHYFEYTIALAARYKQTHQRLLYNKFKEFYEDWIKSNPKGKGDAWEPYTISLRIPNLFICTELFKNDFLNDFCFKEKLMQSIFEQYRFLLSHQEKHLLGNHYFENIKTILLCSLVFEEKDIFQKAFKRLLQQINEQVLSDGIHFERSIMYHKIILEDIIRIAICLKRNGQKSMYEVLLPVIQKMMDALVSLENEMGKTPFFNDAADGVAKETESLTRTIFNYCALIPEYKQSFPDAGYYKLYNKEIAVMIDAGTIGPDYQAGHGHCDCLSFEVSLNNKPLFVNSGTYNYQCKERFFFRSTKAHNIAMITDEEQSQIWAEHRVAKRISNIIIKNTTKQCLVASYKNYKGSTHVRKIEIRKNRIYVDDVFECKNDKKIRSFLHIHPNYHVDKKNNKFEIMDQNNIRICEVHPYNYKNEEIILHTSGDLTYYSSSFGKMDVKNVLEFRWTAAMKNGGYYIEFKN